MTKNTPEYSTLLKLNTHSESFNRNYYLDSEIVQNFGNRDI